MNLAIEDVSWPCTLQPQRSMKRLHEMRACYCNLLAAAAGLYGLATSLKRRTSCGLIRAAPERLHAGAGRCTSSRHSRGPIKQRICSERCPGRSAELRTRLVFVRCIDSISKTNRSKSYGVCVLIAEGKVGHVVFYMDDLARKKPSSWNQRGRHRLSRL